jgi:hypothetical protein
MHVLRRHDAKSIKSYNNIGTMAHGITMWVGKPAHMPTAEAVELPYFVSLDSDNGKVRGARIMMFCLVSPPHSVSPTALI